MNTNTLNMILKLRQWQEELEKQKFVEMLSERHKLELYLKELKGRLDSVTFLKEATSEKIVSIFDEIQYLTNQLIEVQELIKKIDEEVEKQRQLYEEAFKERKKIEQLYDKLITTIKMQREKLEEKLILDVFTSRIRSE